MTGIAAFPRTCPVVLAEDAALMLRTGRAHIAGQVLARLPAAIDEALREAREEGARAAAAERSRERHLAVELSRVRAELDRVRGTVAQQRRELDGLRVTVAEQRRKLAVLRTRREKPAPQPKPPATRPCTLLAEALAAGRVTADRVAVLLRIGVEDVAPIAAGRVGLTSSAWRRVLAEIGR